MSLINKMLRDLDARHAEGLATAMPDKVRPLPERLPPKRLARRLLLPLAVCALLGLALWQSSAYWLPGSPRLPATPPAARQEAPPLVVLALPTVNDNLPRPKTESVPVLAEPGRPAPVAPAKSTIKPMVAAKPQTTVLPKKIELPVAIDKQQHQPSAAERAEQEYRQGMSTLMQERSGDAEAQFRSALREDPRHSAARQTLLAILVEQKRWDEAQSLLSVGLGLLPTQAAWAMALARIQVERGKTAEAWETLQKYQLHGEQNAEYQGFAGALLQRLGKPHEAAMRYQLAVQLRPEAGRWWLGLGLALESEGHGSEAKHAYARARVAGGLSAEMLALIEQRLKP